MPVLTLYSDAIKSYKSVISTMITKTELLDTFVESLPFAMQILAQLLSKHGYMTENGKTKQALAAFEVNDRVK